jgi:hypothetical protein
VSDLIADLEEGFAAFAASQSHHHTPKVVR